MGTVRQTYMQLVKYEIYCEQSKSTIELSVDPDGWQTDDKEFARNEDYHGIFTKFSNNLKFVDESAEFIKFNRALYGVKCQLKLTKYEVHPQTREWVKTYWGYLAMKTYSFENGEVSIKFNSGGIEEIIKNRETTQIEIDRSTDLNGKEIEEIQTDEVAFNGRRIFLKSKWEANNDNNPVRVRVWSNDGNTRYTGVGFPLTLISRSHEEAQSTIPTMGGPGDDGNTGRMILANFDRDRTIRVYARDLKFKPIIYLKIVEWAFLKVCVSVYEGGTDYQLKERRVIFHAGYQSASLPNVFAITGQTFSLNFDETIDVTQGDSIAVEFYMGSDLIGTDFVADIEGFEGFVFAEENSYFKPTRSKFVFVHDMINRISKIITSKNKVFYSEYFGRKDIGYTNDGPGAFVGTTHGFWIRGFDKLPVSTEDFPNLFKPLTTSFRDALDSVRAVFNVGMGIEEYQNQERIRIEDLKYFYNRNTTIKLPNQISKVKRYEAEDFYFSSIESGYENGGDYSEAQGLDEPNGKANYSTTIDVVNSNYSILSKFRADSYGKEFARRKPASVDDTLDTQYDEEIWFLDLKKGLSNIYEQRTWQDDFEIIPSGVFAPDTADSLRLSPLNNLLRHGWYLNSGLLKYPTDYIRYASSSANSQLKTKFIGKNEYIENGNILNSELERPRFVPEWIEFEHECDFFVMQQVQGTTTIQGKEIKNFYGLVEFINEDNELEKGYLFNLKPNSNKWKVLKANR